MPELSHKKTKGILTNDHIREFDQNPRALQEGFSAEWLPTFEGCPTLKLGENGALLINVVAPITVAAVPLIRFNRPEPDSKIARISMSFCDQDGNPMLVVNENEWRVYAGNWDFWTEGKTYAFQGGAEPSLRLRMNAPHYLTIEKLDAYLGGHHFIIDHDGVRTNGVSMQYVVAHNCYSLFDIR